MNPKELADLTVFKGTFKALDEHHGQHLSSPTPIGLFDGLKVARALQVLWPAIKERLEDDNRRSE